MKGNVGIIGGDAQLEEFVRVAGFRPAMLRPDQLAAPTGPVATPDVLLMDIRNDRRLLGALMGIKRRTPALGIAIVAPSLDPTLMLEAMRAGVTEFVAEPVTQAAIESAISRILVDKTAQAEGRVFAIVGAKGGVGATTIAVNVAEALARSIGNTLLIDLHGTGDAAVFIGVEPKFTVTDAVENTHRLDESFFRGLVVHTESGLDLLASSPEIAPSHFDPARVRLVIEFAVRYYRAVVIDVPRGDRGLLNALDMASSVLVVVNHELPTVRAAYRLVSTLRQRTASDRIGVVVNRSDSNAEISLADIEKAVNAKVKHVIPNDYRGAMRGLNNADPAAKSSQTRLGSSFHELARKLSGQAAPPAEEPSRLFGWLTPRRSSQ